MDNSTLKQLHDIELAILKSLDTFCCDNNIQYSIISGTMLGAIRHAGFIPWDDDIDVAMTRDNYKKFCDSIEKNPIDGLYFQNYEKDLFCGVNHGKLRKDNTLFLQKGEDINVGHHGIWIDIFPFDKLPCNLNKRKKIESIGTKIILLTRANVVKSDDSLKKIITRCLIRLIPEKLRHKKLVKYTRILEKNNELLVDDYCWVCMSDLKSIYKVRVSKECCLKYTELEFEGYKFSSFVGYDEFLKVLYGDYMQLPPKEDRIWKHKPEHIEFEYVK